MQTKKRLWQTYKVADSETHHTLDGSPAYEKRFHQVLKFHAPGLAPVLSRDGAYHITEDGEEAYTERYARTFGFYDGLAAVIGDDGWHHIRAKGAPAYDERYDFCGNFQGEICVVRKRDGMYCHIDRAGKPLYSPSYAYAGDFRDGIAVVQNREGKSTHILEDGSLLHGKWFDDLDVFHKGFARAKDGKGWMHIDRDAAPQYPERYAMVEPFYNGLARVEGRDGARFLIDETGSPSHHLREQTQDPFHIASAELVSYWRYHTLQTAIELAIFDDLPSSPPNSNLVKLLLALEEIGLVKKDSSNWHATEVGAFFAKNHPSSLALAAKMWNAEPKKAWEGLTSSLLTARPAFEEQFGKPIFAYLEEHEAQRELHHKAFAIYAKRDYQKIAEKLKFEDHTSILDVGGGNGELLKLITKSNPTLIASLFDLPGVIEQTPPLDQIKKISGDFFSPMPNLSVQSIILSRILHDWSDDKALKILRNVIPALAQNPESRIYIIENILGEGDSSGALLNLHVHVMTGGKERTLKEFKELLRGAYLEIEETLPLSEVTSILVAKRSSDRDRK